MLNNPDRRNALEVEGVAEAITHESGDATEGWEAFLQRRNPDFSD